MIQFFLYGCSYNGSQVDRKNEKTGLPNTNHKMVTDAATDDVAANHHIQYHKCNVNTVEKVKENMGVIIPGIFSDDHMWAVVMDTGMQTRAGLRVRESREWGRVRKKSPVTFPSPFWRVTGV